MNLLDFFWGGGWLAPKVIRVQDTVPLWSCFFRARPISLGLCAFTTALSGFIK